MNATNGEQTNPPTRILFARVRGLLATSLFGHVELVSDLGMRARSASPDGSAAQFSVGFASVGSDQPPSVAVSQV
jgi:hypothetical protein